MKLFSKFVIPILVLPALIFLSGCTQGGEVQREVSSASGVPIYANSQSYSVSPFILQIVRIPTEGVTIKAYYVKNASVQDVLNWYKEKMKEYTLLNEIRYTKISVPQGSVEFGGMIYRKGNTAIGIWAMGGNFIEGGKGVVYYIGTGPVEKLYGNKTAEKGKELPSSDTVSGEEPVERYPGSVMLSYEKDSGYPSPGASLRITYGTKDSMQNVAEWYKSKFTSEGWKLESESASEEMIDLYFTKNSKVLEITLYAPDVENNFVTIGVMYTPNELPSEDKVSGEEPVTRYPGAVMLEHTSTEVGSVKSIVITYGTNDNRESVYNWYLENLPKEGWQVMSKGEDGGEYFVSASKGNSFLEIRISDAGYTQISVTFTGMG